MPRPAAAETPMGRAPAILRARASSPEQDLRLYRWALAAELACSADPRWPPRSEIRRRIAADLFDACVSRADAFAAHNAALAGLPHDRAAARAWRRAVARAILAGPWAP